MKFLVKHTRLRKSIYRLRDSSRRWNICIHDHLISQDFVRSKNDLCLYVHKRGKNITYLLLYVDDIFIVSSNDSEMNRLRLELSKRFKISDLSNDNKFLGIDLKWKREKGEVSLSQANYIETIMEINLKIKPSDNDVITEKNHFVN